MPALMQQDVLMLVCGFATYQTLFFYLLMHRAAWLRAAACGSGYCLVLQTSKVHSSSEALTRTAAPLDGSGFWLTTGNMRGGIGGAVVYVLFTQMAFAGSLQVLGDLLVVPVLIDACELQAAAVPRNPGTLVSATLVQVTQQHGNSSAAEHGMFPGRLGLIY
jgi:hypothetical protein